MVFIALLRGINVSGQKKILMSDLKILFENLSFSDVKTYIQSGNVIFSTEESDTKLMEKKIEEKILAQYGFQIPVLVLTTDEIKNALDNNPFLKNTETLSDKDDPRLYFTFLSEIPNVEHVKKIDVALFAPDTFTLLDKTIFMKVENGYGNTKLSNNFFETKLKVKATTRNLKTLQMISQLVG